MEIFTIGFTQTTAEDFFGRLKSHGIERLLDVRLNNRSQLAGFAKRDDLAYFLRELISAEYEHAPFLAPSQEILDAYKKQKTVDPDDAAGVLSPHLVEGPVLLGNRGGAVPEEEASRGWRHRWRSSARSGRSSAWSHPGPGKCVRGQGFASSSVAGATTWR
jgi:hypothetical protein